MRTTRSLSIQPTNSATPSERRTRSRLRELCDEVLWSYRIADERDLISEQERTEARAILSRVTPITR